MPRLSILAWLLLASVASAAGADTITLENGDEIQGTVLERTDERIVVEHENLGRLEIPADQLHSGEKPGLFGTGLLEGWDRHLELGVNGADGNSNTFLGRAGLHVGRKTDFHRTSIDGAFLLTRDDGEDTAKNAFLQAQHDFLAPHRRWFPFLLARWDYDDFRDFDHQLALSTGVGYDILKSERFELSGRLGAGVSRRWGGVDDDWTPEALIGVSGAFHVDSRQRVTFYVTQYPDLSDLAEYRNLAGAAYVVDVGERDGISLKLGLDNEYYSNVGPDKKRNDVKYYGALLYDF